MVFGSKKISKRKLSANGKRRPSTGASASSSTGSSVAPLPTPEAASAFHSVDQVDDDETSRSNSSSGPLGLSIDAEEGSSDDYSNGASLLLTQPPAVSTPMATTTAAVESLLVGNASSASGIQCTPPTTIQRGGEPVVVDVVAVEQQQRLLQDRVEQLELKLATLSRLLQLQTTPPLHPTQQQQQPQRQRTPDRCVSPLVTRDTINTSSEAATATVTATSSPVPRSRRNRRMMLTAASPHLESPAPHASADRKRTATMRGMMMANRDDVWNETAQRLLPPQQQQQLPGSPPITTRGVSNIGSSNSKNNKLEKSSTSGDGGGLENSAAAADPKTTTTKSDEDDPPPASSQLSQHKRNRNLSLTLLFEGNEEEYQKHSSTSGPDATHSMTPAERQWLRPQLLQFVEKQQQQQTTTSRDNSQQNFVYDHEQDIHQPLLPNEDKAERRSTENNNNSQKTTTAAVKTPTRGSSDQQHQVEQQQHASSKDNNNNSYDTPITSRHRSGSIIAKELVKKKLQTKWLDYLNSVQEATPDVDVQMQEFIKVPSALEGILGFGLLICVDSFLYMFTVLPIRFVWSCLLLLIKMAHWKRRKQPHEHFQFHRRHLYQIIQCVIVFVITSFVLQPISIGKLYHWIRGQAMIKLYVIIAMVEIFDRLFSSLGQDCLDSLYWNSITRPGSRRFIVSVLVVLVYAAMHTLILFVHVATLNVAMNSHDQALLSLLIGGNFAEIKSTVFKKFNKAALFKITASDICERFKLALFLSLVLLLNISQGMNQKKEFLGYFRICGIVWSAELISDWIKHAFITKFNFLPARVYPEYALLLAGDVTGIGHEGVSLDHSHAVVKRIGFAQIPLLCVMFRLVNEATIKFMRNYQEETTAYSSSEKTTTMNWFFGLLQQSLFAFHGVAAYFLLWAVLLVLKLGLGLWLQRLSFGKLYAAPEYSQLTPLLLLPKNNKNNKAKKNQ